MQLSNLNKINYIKMRLFVKIYADDLKSACSSIPVTIKGAPFEITIGQMKQEMEQQIEPSIKVKN